MVEQEQEIKKNEEEVFEFSPEKLDEVWASFTEKLQEDGRDSEYTMLSQNRTLEGNIITLEIHNSLQESMLESIKSELMEVLRTRLSNKQLDITTHRVEQVKKDRPYTAKEKMEYFEKKNPAFGEMVKRFGLDAEF